MMDMKRYMLICFFISMLGDREKEGLINRSSYYKGWEIVIKKS